MKVLEVIEPGSIALLKVADTLALEETPVAPAIGIVDMTVGGTSLVPVVNDQTYGTSRNWFAKFFTPVLIVTVITMFWGISVSSFRVAVRPENVIVGTMLVIMPEKIFFLGLPFDQLAPFELV